MTNAQTTHQWTYCVCVTVATGPFLPIMFGIIYLLTYLLTFHSDFYGTPIHQDSKQFTCMNWLQ